MLNVLVMGQLEFSKKVASSSNFKCTGALLRISSG
jgi:hypothetical protein